MKDNKVHEKIMDLVGKYFRKDNALGSNALRKLGRTMKSDVTAMAFDAAYESFLHDYKDQGRKGVGISMRDIEIKRDQLPDDPSGRSPWTKYQINGLEACIFLLPGSVAYRDGTAVLFQTAINDSKKTIAKYQKWNDFHRRCIDLLRKHHKSVMSACPPKAVMQLFDDHYPERQAKSEAEAA